MKRIKTKISFVRLGIEEEWTYRFDFFLFQFGDLLSVLINFFIWKAVFENSTQEKLEGFSLKEMYLYIFLSFFANTLIYSDVSFHLGEEIKNGNIIYRFLKPINFVDTYLFKEIGSKVSVILFLVAPFFSGLLYLVYNDKIILNNLSLHVLGFTISISFAYLLNFYFNICFSYSAFIFKNLWGANLLKKTMISFISGSILPLSFFPKNIQSISEMLPFSSIIYTPIMIGIGKYAGKTLVLSILIQLFWVCFFMFLSEILLRLTLKFLVIHGG